MSESLNNGTPIYEDSDFCEVCGSAGPTLDFMLPTDKPDEMAIPVCQDCKDNGRFRAWLVTQIEEALSADPTWRRLPNGKWRHIEAKA